MLYFTLFLTILGTVVGQLLTKQGMLIAGNMPSGKIDAVLFLMKNMIINPFIVSGLLCAVFAAMSWMATLSKSELSFAYPFMSLAFPIVMLLSGMIFGEHLSFARWIGMAVIMFGLVIVAKS
jgi:drug/metabolite transporter (DMT)-like permease